MLGPGHLVAVHDVDELLELCTELAQPPPKGEQLALACGPGDLGLGALVGRLGQRDREPPEAVLGAGEHGRGDDGLALAAVAALDRPPACLALVAGGPLEAVGSARERTLTLLAGAHAQPGIDLDLPGSHGGLGQPVALGGVGVVVARLGLSGLQPRLEAGERCGVVVAGPRRGRDGGRQPVGLGRGRPGGRAELAELLGDRRHPGVAVVQPLERCLDHRRGLRLLARGGLELEPHPLRGVGGLGEASAGLVDGSLDLEQARSARRPADGQAPAEHVAVAGDRDEGVVAPDERPRTLEVVDDDHALEQAGQGQPQVIGRDDRVEGVPRALGQHGPGRRVGATTAGDEQGGAACLLALERCERLDR